MDHLNLILIITSLALIRRESFAFPFDYSDFEMGPLAEVSYQHHIVPRSPSSKNQDRALGFNGNKNKKSSKRSYPWDKPSDQVKLVYPDSVQKHEVKDEDPFQDDYYDEYDFEFAKGMVKNGNWEGKAREMLEGMMKNGFGAS